MEGSPKNAACVECEDAPATVVCNECEDSLCGLCFNWLHQRGTRSSHTFTQLPGAEDEMNAEGTTRHFAAESAARDASRETIKANLISHEGSVGSTVEESFAQRARFVPIRLDEEERELLRLLEGALDVSEYTDKVDVASNDFGWGYGMGTTKKTSRMSKYLQEVMELIYGLYVSVHFKKGQRGLKKELVEHEAMLRRVFEVGRRHKVMNPSKMRTTYGKMMSILQDAPDHRAMGVNLNIPIVTVHAVLRQHDKLALLDDERLLQSAVGGLTDLRLLTAEEARVAAQRRKDAIAQLVERHVDNQFPEELLMRVVHSLGDANAYISGNRHPVDKMINYLKHYFEPDSIPTDTSVSLAIRGGRGGSKLTHDHSTQFRFVMQSLQLWREIQNRMYELWMCADADLQDPNNPYRLYNTGQGMQRVQSAGRVSRAMSDILGVVRGRLRHSWVGLSVVHLGDRDVPNALTFIDKYTQVPRILAPIVSIIERVGVMAQEDENVRNHLDEEWGGVEALRLLILQDYFRHGFDGSGSDGGSCIARGTPISLANGTSVPIESMAERVVVAAPEASNPSAQKDAKQARVASVSARTASVTRVIDNGERSCVELTLEDGSTLVCTPEHLVMTCDGTWCRADELPLGDTHQRVTVSPTVCVADCISPAEQLFELAAESSRFHMRTPEARAKTLALMRVAGYMLADAKYSTAGEVQCVLHTRHDVDLIQADMELLLGRKATVCPRESGAFSLRPGASLAKVLVGTFFLHATLPSFLSSDTTPVSVVREFLAGYFGASSNAPLLTSNGKLARVALSLTCERQLEAPTVAHMNTVLALMSRCGVDTTDVEVRTVVRSADRLEVAFDLPNLLDFAENVGFRFSVQKQLRLAAACVCFRRALSHSRDMDEEEDTEAFLASIGAHAWFDDASGSLDGSLLPTLSLKVIARRDAGTHQVYDLSVPGPTSFFANAIGVHNCIDGRLTSSWNWCSKLSKKQYEHMFLLCGFDGFDGDFRA